MSGDGSDGCGAGLAESPAEKGLRDAAVLALAAPRSRLQRRGVTRGIGSGAPPNRVLLIDPAMDDVAVLFDLLGRADEGSFTVEHVEDVRYGLARLMAGGCDVALIAQEQHQGEDGLGLIRDLARRGVDTPVILLAAAPSPGLEIAAIDAGAADFLDKEELEVGRLERAIAIALARRRRLERLSRPALLDPLTGLAGHHAFIDRLEHALARARRIRRPGAVVMLDIDRFEQVNRAVGLVGGDSLLRLVAGRLRRQLRATDTAARLYGDRFGVVVEELARPEHAVSVSLKLLAALSSQVAVAGRNVTVTATAGVSVFGEESTDPVVVMARAEAALRSGKAEGGNCCRVAAQRGEEAWPADITTRALALRRALHADELTLLFQPQVTLSNSAIGLAALAGWRDEAGHVLGFAAIRELADTAAATEPLAEWLLQSACRQAARWRTEGLPRLFVSVPLLSRRQLAWSDLPRRIEHQMDRSGLAPDELELAIDERMLIAEDRPGIRALESLSALGLRLAVEDFGGGLAPLALLRDLPIATVRLAPRALAGVPDDATSTACLALLIRLAKELRLRVVASGAETQGQLQFLRQLGCDAVQALICCPPLPAVACTDWLREAQRRD